MNKSKINNVEISVSRRMLEPVLEDWIGWYNDHKDILSLSPGYRTRFEFARSLLREIKRLNQEQDKNDEADDEKG